MTESIQFSAILDAESIDKIALAAAQKIGDLPPSENSNLADQIAELSAEIETIKTNADGDANAILPKHFTAGQKPERYSKINGTISTPYLYYRLITKRIGEVKKGSLVDFNASCQISSKNKYNLMVASVVKIHEGQGSSWVRNLSDWDGEELSEAMGENIDNNVHHKPVHQNGKRKLAKNYNDAHISMIVYVASTAYRSGDVITVDQDYGRLEGTITPPGGFTMID